MQNRRWLSWSTVAWLLVVIGGVIGGVVWYFRADIPDDARPERLVQSALLDPETLSKPSYVNQFAGDEETSKWIHSAMEMESRGRFRLAEAEYGKASILARRKFEAGDKKARATLVMTLMDQAHVRMRMELYSRAIDLFTEVIMLSSRPDEALRERAQAHIKMGKVNHAVDDYKRAARSVAQENVFVAGSCLRDLANLYEDQKDFKSRDKWEQVIRGIENRMIRSQELLEILDDKGQR